MTRIDFTPPFSEVRNSDSDGKPKSTLGYEEQPIMCKCRCKIVPDAVEKMYHLDQ